MKDAYSGVKLYNGSTGASQGIFVPFNSGGLTFPLGGAIGPDGNLYVSNSDGDDVLRYNGVTGAFINTFIPDGTGGLADPAGLIFRNGLLYVAQSSLAGAVSRFNATTGAFVDTFVAPGSGGLSDPEGMAFGPDGNCMSPMVRVFFATMALPARSLTRLLHQAAGD